jgi:hypothetical protein
MLSLREEWQLFMLGVLPENVFFSRKSVPHSSKEEGMMGIAFIFGLTNTILTSLVEPSLANTDPLKKERLNEKNNVQALVIFIADDSVR